MTRSVLACAGAIALTLTGCGPSGDAPFLSENLAPPKVDRVQSAQRTEYRLAADDTIEVSVYQVPDLNRTVQVDGAGRVGLPLIGAVQASGRTVRELEQDIAKRLGDRYLQSPQVAVFVKDAIGQRMTIEGAVKKPGVIQARGEMTLLQVIAEAQGFGETADLGAVYIFRQTEKGRMVARFDAAAIRRGAAPDPQIYGGDTIIVDDSMAKTAWKHLREAAPITNIYRLW